MTCVKVPHFLGFVLVSFSVELTVLVVAAATRRRLNSEEKLTPGGLIHRISHTGICVGRSIFGECCE